jgi:predicted transposase/invertase (TIGR01784 family)
MMGVNTQYKDSVFSFLLSDPDTLRELYGAVAGIRLSPDVPITINTLEGVLYKTLLNDISFEIDKKLVVLVEQQSTINPNMAVRLLLYIARVYEKITAGKNIYGSKQLTIPQPEFIVFYNGKAPYPEKTRLKLSDAFEDAVSLGILKGTEPQLELIVQVYNINPGYNETLVRGCERLKGYCEFITKVREYEQGNGGREMAMKEAIRWCIGNNILRVFFETHGSEVVNMLMTEWKLEEALVVEREEGREEGWVKAHKETVKNLTAFGMSPESIAQALKIPVETVQRYRNGAD